MAIMDVANPSVAKTLVQGAEALYRAGDYAAAAAGLEPLVSAASPLPAAVRILGLCRLRLGAVKDGVALLAQAYSMTPDDPWTILHYGIGLQAVGRDAQAIDLLRAARKLLPGNSAPAINLALSLLALSDVPGAIESARKGRLYGPAMPQSHYVLGTAYLAGQYFDRAAECFRTAAKLAPGFADAWVNLGVAHYWRGDIYAAQDAMRRALKADPENAAATANLAALLRLTGEVDASELLLRRSMEKNPQAAATRINLAADLLQEDRNVEALTLLDGPLPAAKDTRQQWQLQKILALIKVGRLAEARDVIADIGEIQAALLPLLQWRLALLALAEKNFAASDRAAAAMEGALEQASILPEHRIMGHYDLGRFWSQRRAPDKAFPHWVKGHRQLARFQPFSRQQYSDFVDANIERFNVARLASGARAANDDPTPVFVVGMPRSGQRQHGVGGQQELHH